MEIHDGPRLLNEAEKPGKTHFIILGMSWAGWLFDFYDLMLFSFLLVPIKKDLGLSDYEVSTLLGVSLAATALGGIIFGYLSDRIGRKHVLCLTIVAYSIGTFFCGISQTIYSLFVFRVITGLGVGGEWATGQTLVGETFPAKMRGRFAAVMQTGAPAGVALAAIVGGFLQPFFTQRLGLDWGWRACFLLSVLPAVLIIFIRQHMPESDVWERRRAQKETSEGGQFLDLLRLPNLRRLFLLGLVLSLTDMSAYWYTYTWLPKYMYDKLGFSMAKSGLWMLAMQSGGLLGYLSFGLVADWKGRRWAYSGFSIIWAIGLLAVTWFWGLIAAWPLLSLAFMFVAGFGTGNFSGYGPIFSEIFPTKVRGTAMGTAFNMGRGAQFFTPIIITWVAGRWGLGGGISLGAFFAIFTGLWVWTLPETRGIRITAEG